MQLNEYRTTTQIKGLEKNMMLSFQIPFKTLDGEMRWFLFKAAGEHVLYTDTDSVHLHTKGRKEFEKHISLGDELGEWKLETPTPLHSGIYYEPKAYTHFDRNGKRIQVKHKGVTLKDHTGEMVRKCRRLNKDTKFN